jgi:hypothetical protein
MPEQRKSRMAEEVGVGAAALLLLFIGIHNAWDGVAYHVFVNLGDQSAQRRRDEGSGKME